MENPRVVFLKDEDEVIDSIDSSTTFLITSTSTTTNVDLEDDSLLYKKVGLSIQNSVKDSIDVTRMDKEYAILLKSVREECEEGLSQYEEFNIFNENENEVWSYRLRPENAVLNTITKKCSGISNITILFRGRAHDGILNSVDSAYLTFNDRVIDIASMAPNQEDRRVATFRGFSESNPFMFSCMSETDKLKIFIRFRKSPESGRNMIRILADLVCFDSQDDYLHQSWITPLQFDTQQEIFYNCSKTPSTLTIQGKMSLPSNLLQMRTSRGWPHSFDSEYDDSDNDKESTNSSKSSSSSQLLEDLQTKFDEYKLRQEWQKKIEEESKINESRDRAKHSIHLMQETLYKRGRAYSDEDIFNLQRLFGNVLDKGMSPEAEALCAIEIARWKTQKQILEDDLLKLEI
jgi:hypothetical protein